MRGLLVIFLALFAVDNALGFCGICGEKSGAMCRDATTFSICFDGINPDPDRYNCPVGTFCGDDLTICSKNVSNKCDPACGKCTSRFACLSENTYALCFGQGFPSGNVYRCPEGTFCSTQMKTSSGTEFCFHRMSLINEQIDCYKDIVVRMSSAGDGNVLIPLPGPQVGLDAL